MSWNKTNQTSKKKYFDPTDAWYLQFQSLQYFKIPTYTRRVHDNNTKKAKK